MTTAKRTKALTLAIAILLTLANVAATYANVLTPTWGAVVATVGAALYGGVRTLQKLLQGTPLKAILGSTEMLAAGLVLAANVVGAAKSVVSPGTAAVLGGISVATASALRVIQGMNAAQIAVPGLGGTEAPTKPETPSAKGSPQ